MMKTLGTSMNFSLDNKIEESQMIKKLRIKFNRRKNNCHKATLKLIIEAALPSMLMLNLGIQILLEMLILSLLLNRDKK